MPTENPYRPDDTNDEFKRGATDDERVVQDILQAHCKAPDPDDTFVDRLSNELQREFAVESAKQPRTIVAPVAGNTAAGARRTSARWISGLVAATIILSVFGIWSRKSVASWSEMIETLRSQPWVQTDAGRSSGWFSASRRVVARRGVARTVYASREDNRFQTYSQSDGRVVTGEAPSVASRSSFDEDMIDWLAANAFDTDASEDDFSEPLANQEWRVVSESSRYVSDSVGRWIELTVVFALLDSPSDTFSVVFLVNPQTKLPVECMVHSDAAKQKLSFDYPAEGPLDIFDMGVSRNAPLVTREENQRLRWLNKEKTDLEEDRVVEKMQPAAVAESRPKETVALIPEKPVVEPEHEEPPPDSVATSKNANAAASDSVASDATPKPTVPAVPALPVPATSVAMTAEVDQLVSQLWTRKEASPTSVATDEEFLRRVYLDVIGRVPTISEYDSFFELDAADRRGELVEQLLDSREHALHMGSIWKRVLVPDDETAISRLGGAGKLEQWLSDSFTDNKPYDQLVRELLLAEGRVNESGPLLFYAAAKLNAEELAARTSRTFLGMRMECAECHDHPFDEWSQTDFWGLAAYFARISRPQGKIEMVSPVLRVHDADFGEVTLPESDVVVEPRLPMTDSMTDFQPKEKSAEDLKDAEVVGNSRRKELADWITDPGNTHFAQATVNRIWGHLFGKGLVDPVDDMGSHNLASDPELLAQLGRYFVQSDFDLRELMRVLINSRAYQLTSRNETSEEVSDAVKTADADIMARMHLKPLTAEQLYDCLATATGRSDLASVRSTNLTPASIAVNRFSDPGRAAFLAQFRGSIDQRTDYQAGIPQALTLMNGPMIFSATSDAPKGILRSLSAPFFSDEARVEKLFIATLSRKPTDDERKRYAELLKDQPADTPKHETLGDILWVLLNSTEFTMNH